MATVSTTTLTGSGFSEAQASAITRTVQATANDAVEILRHDIARWHAYLALYLLIQIGIVLLAILIVQAVREPSRTSSSTPASFAAMDSTADLRSRAIQGKNCVNANECPAFRTETSS
jgi:hypothetical protein